MQTSRCKPINHADYNSVSVSPPPNCLTLHVQDLLVLAYAYNATQKTTSNL